MNSHIGLVGTEELKSFARKNWELIHWIKSLDKFPGNKLDLLSPEQKEN